MGRKQYKLLSTLLLFMGLTFLGLTAAMLEPAKANPGDPPQIPYTIPPFWQKKPLVLPPTKLPPSITGPLAGSLPPNITNPNTTSNPPAPPVTPDPGTETPPGSPTPQPQGNQPGSGTQSTIPLEAAKLLPAGTITTSAGTLTVEPVSGALALNVDQKSLVGLIAAAKETKQGRIIIPIVNPSGAPIKQYQATIPREALNLVSKGQEELVIATEIASVLLPPKVLQALTQASASAKSGTTAGELKVILQPASGTDRLQISQQAGEAVEVDFWLIDTNGKTEKIKSFASPVTLTLKYDSKTPQAKLARLGVYRLNPETGTWAYSGGKVDVATGTISVERTSFSTYSVRLYEQGYLDLVGHWAREDVELLAGQGLVKGLDTLTYGPEQKITRAEFATLLQRALKLPEAKTTRFKDIRTQDWYAGSVSAAAQAGLVTGSPDGAFQPNKSITRQEMAVMLARALNRQKLPNGNTDTLKVFADRSQIAPWARQQLATAVQAGLIKGQSANNFVPSASASRAEAAVMLKRLILKLNTVIN